MIEPNFIEQKQASVKCIFYISEAEKNIQNTPAIICRGDMGVATINCHLKLTGNLKRLRKCKLNMELPTWLTSQVNVSDIVLGYSENQLKWEFDRLLPETGLSKQVAEYKNKISFIRNVEDNNLLIKLEPQMKKHCGIKFETNGIRIQNGE